MMATWFFFALRCLFLFFIGFKSEIKGLQSLTRGSPHRDPSWKVKDKPLLQKRSVGVPYMGESSRKHAARFMTPSLISLVHWSKTCHAVLKTWPNLKWMSWVASLTARAAKSLEHSKIFSEGINQSLKAETS